MNYKELEGKAITMGQSPDINNYVLLSDAKLFFDGIIKEIDGMIERKPESNKSLTVVIDSTGSDIWHSGYDFALTELKQKLLTPDK